MACKGTRETVALHISIILAYYHVIVVIVCK